MNIDIETKKLVDNDGNEIPEDALLDLSGQPILPECPPCNCEYKQKYEALLEKYMELQTRCLDYGNKLLARMEIDD